MISVVVPVYNVFNYLDRCIQSLLTQTYKDYEIILIDDGSTDGSKELCDQFALTYEQIFSFHKINGGLSSARNLGAQKARGEWITFVDSDDYVTESYLQNLYDLIIKFNADMAITRVELRLESQANEIRPKRFDDFVTDKQGGFFEVYIGNKIGWSGCGKLLKTVHVLNNPFPDGFYEDSASAYLFIDQCDRIAIGDYENNYKYLRRDGSITASKLSKNHYHIFEVSEQIEKYININMSNKSYYATLVYANAVLQLLNRISMSKEEYKQIFMMYRAKFRKDTLSILRKHDITFKSKIYLIVLCTTPQFFQIFSNAVERKKKNV